VVRNPFRNPVMRREFDAAVRAYEMRHRDLFRDAKPYKHGSSFANFFWAGYDGRIAPGAGVGFKQDASSRNMIAYAYFRAGELLAKADPQFVGIPYTPTGIRLRPKTLGGA
jgi:hypothetical protein